MRIVGSITLQVVTPSLWAWFSLVLWGQVEEFSFCGTLKGKINVYHLGWTWWEFCLLVRAKNLLSYMSGTMPSTKDNRKNRSRVSIRHLSGRARCTSLGPYKIATGQRECELRGESLSSWGGEGLGMGWDCGIWAESCRKSGNPMGENMRTYPRYGGQQGQRKKWEMGYHVRNIKQGMVCRLYSAD